MNDYMQGLVSYMVAFIAGVTGTVNDMNGEDWLQAGAVVLLVARLLQDVPRGIASAIKTYRRIASWVQKRKL